MFRIDRRIILKSCFAATTGGGLVNKVCGVDFFTGLFVSFFKSSAK